eukprot:scaffold10121_cov64-Cyclotella_meneghiniana.AAC.8
MNNPVLQFCNVLGEKLRTKNLPSSHTHNTHNLTHTIPYHRARSIKASALIQSASTINHIYSKLKPNTQSHPTSPNQHKEPGVFRQIQTKD